MTYEECSIFYMFYFKRNKVCIQLSGSNAIGITLSCMKLLLGGKGYMSISPFIKKLKTTYIKVSFTIFIPAIPI